jgi:methylated-DNA-[protein]-cysteine S-methyltransferase
LDYSLIATPVGDFAVAWRVDGIYRMWFVDAGGDTEVAPEGTRHDSAAFGAGEQLAAYFAGALQDFELPLRPQGTPFQLKVWQALQLLPYGTTSSYGELAASLGCPGAARAVGGANHNNPLPVVIPCHRVVGADGKLGGYAGGVRCKRFLLDHELRHTFGHKGD